MRHTLIRRFTTETQKLRRKDTDVDDPDERFVLVDESAAAAAAESISDASQHTQEERAAPWQEDPGILELMRPALLSRSFLSKVLWTILWLFVLPTHPGQRSSFDLPSRQPLTTVSTLSSRLISSRKSSSTATVTIPRPPTLIHFQSKSKFVRVGYVDSILGGNKEADGATQMQHFHGVRL